MRARMALIAAVSPQGVIGINNTIPWHYPADLARFKRLTQGHTVLMGRLTWESLPRKPLPHRRNVVITSQAASLQKQTGEVECFASLQEALDTCTGEVWCIGGARLYQAVMPLAQLIDLTYVPDVVEGAGAVYFPPIDPREWVGSGRHPLPEDPRLEHEVFHRRESRNTEPPENHSRRS